MPEPSIAVLLPCHNEEAAIAGVVRAFRAALPEAAIYVFDNNSTDGTAKAASEAGAIVRHESLQGKGFVMRRMFRDIQADLYVIADGDGTYDAALAPAMIALARGGPHDLVNCIRRETGQAAYRGGHRFGNRA
ncbi:MAG TPA: glycosyltransferase family 2 protein, partial [Acidiphilium sp.]